MVTYEESVQLPDPGVVRKFIESFDYSATVHHRARSLVGHQKRYIESFRFTPLCTDPGQKVLEVGTSPLTYPVLTNVHGYNSLYFVEYDRERPRLEKARLSVTGGREVVVNYLDIERHYLSYDTGAFDMVLCWEVIEHITRDPGFVLCELNRVLKRDGLLLLTTPNITSSRSIERILNLDSPYVNSKYSSSGKLSARRQYEYSPLEINDLMKDYGFECCKIGTFYSYAAHNDVVEKILSSFSCNVNMRGDTIIYIGQKTESNVKRFSSRIFNATYRDIGIVCDVLTKEHKPMLGCE